MFELIFQQIWETSTAKSKYPIGMSNSVFFWIAAHNLEPPWDSEAAAKACEAFPLLVGSSGNVKHQDKLGFEIINIKWSWPSVFLKPALFFVLTEVKWLSISLYGQGSVSSLLSLTAAGWRGEGRALRGRNITERRGFTRVFILLWSTAAVGRRLEWWLSALITWYGQGITPFRK